MSEYAASYLTSGSQLSFNARLAEVCKTKVGKNMYDCISRNITKYNIIQQITYSVNDRGQRKTGIVLAFVAIFLQ